MAEGLLPTYKRTACLLTRPESHASERKYKGGGLSVRIANARR